MGPSPGVYAGDKSDLNQTPIMPPRTSVGGPRMKAKAKLDAAVAKLPPKAQAAMAEHTTAADEATH
jgi:hypothetical protein